MNLISSGRGYWCYNVKQFFYNIFIANSRECWLNCACITLTGYDVESRQEDKKCDRVKYRNSRHQLSYLIIHLFLRFDSNECIFLYKNAISLLFQELRWTNCKPREMTQSDLALKLSLNQLNCNTRSLDHLKYLFTWHEEFYNIQVLVRVLYTKTRKRNSTTGENLHLVKLKNYYFYSTACTSLT